MRAKKGDCVNIFMRFWMVLLVAFSELPASQDNSDGLNTLADNLTVHEWKGLRSYKALYQSIPPTNTEKNSTYFEGEMSVSFTAQGKVWLYDERGSGYTVNKKNRVNPFSWTYQLRETQDGTSLTFLYIIKQGKKVVVHQEGQVTFDPLTSKGTIYWEKPYSKAVKISHPLVFPTHLLTHVMQNVGATPYTTSGHLFDGRTRNHLPAVSCFLSKPKAIRWVTKTGQGQTIVAWPLFQAFYQEETEGEKLAPTSHQRALVTKDGVPLKLLKQVGTQEIFLVLKKLQ